MPFLLFFAALAAPQPVAASSDNAFSGLWTRWNGANRESVAAERQAIRDVREDVASATPERLRALRDQGRALGELVGEIVATGDCDEGERLARLAGDFALVEAVRGYCARPVAAPR